MLPPTGNDPIEMLKDDLAYLASQAGRAVVFELLNDFETVQVQPILALRIALHRMNVHRLVALVRVEMRPPALPIENGVADKQLVFVLSAFICVHLRPGSLLPQPARLTEFRTSTRANSF